MKKILKVALALMMAFGIQVATLGSVNAAETSNLPDGEYTVPTSLMNASNIANTSMAGGALAKSGTLVVANGSWSLIAEFKTLDFGGAGTVFGNASNIKYYQNGLNSEKLDAQIISMRNDATVTTDSGVLENQEAVKEVKIPVAVNSTGIYINLFVDFMNYAPDAYLAFSTEAAVSDTLADLIEVAKAKVNSEYTVASYEALQTAITNAEAVSNGTEAEKAAQYSALNDALNALVSIYNIADGTYSLPVDVLKADKDEQSMAAGAVKSATISVENNQIEVTLTMSQITMYGMTMGIDSLKYQLNDGSYVDAVITASDPDEGFVTEAVFTLDSNVKITNVQFFYGGSNRASDARLLLDLDALTSINTSVFASDGTYNVDVALWNATQDQASMANGALETQATIVVKDGVATMYINTKEMTMGTIKAWLEELYIGSINDDYKANPATAYATNNDGKVTMWSFALPSEEEFFDVVVNPRVAMMNNADIAARIKVDYETLEKVSDSSDAPVIEDNNDSSDTTGDGGTVDNTITPESTTNNNTNSTNTDSVKTGDNVNMELMGGLLISSLALITYYTKKKLCK